MSYEDRRILPKTAAGRAVMDVIDAVLNEDDMPCGFDYDHAAVAAIVAVIDAGKAVEEGER